MNDFIFAPSKIEGYGVKTNFSLRQGRQIDMPYAWLNGGDPSVFWNNSFDGMYPSLPWCFLNHSDVPNAEMCQDEHGNLFLEILRDVEAYEELTINYGPDYDWQYED